MARKKRPPTVEERAEQEYEEWLARIEQYHVIAEKAYKAQNKNTREAIDVMVDRIAALSFGVLKFNGVTKVLPQELRRKNALYFATEILKDLAMVDIQVADYEFIAEVCASCGATVGKKKKKGKSK